MILSDIALVALTTTDDHIPVVLLVLPSSLVSPRHQFRRLSRTPASKRSPLPSFLSPPPLFFFSFSFFLFSLNYISRSSRALTQRSFLRFCRLVRLVAPSRYRRRHSTLFSLFSLFRGAYDGRRCPSRLSTTKPSSLSCKLFHFPLAQFSSSVLARLRFSCAVWDVHPC